MTGQRKNIVFPVSQGGNLYGNDIEPVKQVFADFPFLHGGFQAGEDGAADDGMADVQFPHAR